MVQGGLKYVWCDQRMSFMTGDRLTLDLEQYFKIYLFSFACAIISQSWLLSIRTNVYIPSDHGNEIYVP